MSAEYAKFLDPVVQHENYQLIGLDKSILEVNQKLFWENNANFFGMKEKYQFKKKGVELKSQATMDTFLKEKQDGKSETTSEAGGRFEKFKKRPAPISLRGNTDDRNSKRVIATTDKKDA